MQIEARHSNGVTILAVGETRVDATNAQAFREEIMRRLDDGRGRVVVDLSATEFMDSSALGVLVSAVQRVGARGAFAVAGVQGAVSRLVTLTGLGRILDLHPTADDALELMAA